MGEEARRGASPSLRTPVTSCRGQGCERCVVRSDDYDIGDEATLLDLVAEVGLDRDDVRAVLADRRYAERVDASTREANELGVHAIPAFVLDRRLVVLGAQPREVFQQAFTQLDEENEWQPSSS